MKFNYYTEEDTIYAQATGKGESAIAIIRISGQNTLKILKKCFKPRAKSFNINKIKSHTAYLGWFHYNNKVIDEVLITYFKAPNSYTGEDLLEISCHGSVYVQKIIMQALSQLNIRYAQNGEFTFRAFRNGKMDLSQAEAVADIISANSETSHNLALQQMKGGFSFKIKDLRTKLVNFASLIELELDFSEEDVNFVDRKEIFKLLSVILKEITFLKSSFALGNIMRNGIPIAIAGKPNTGKSTLLNALLNEERAIVSDIPGTTRDTIEDILNIDGATFRFIDTAGLRETYDTLENYGIERSYNKIDEAEIVLYVFDINTSCYEDVISEIEEIKQQINNKDKIFIPIANKIDQLIEAPNSFKKLLDINTIFISAKRNENINVIIERLIENINIGKINDKTIVYNLRHYEALNETESAINNVKNELNKNTYTELIAIEIKQALYHLGTITGEITTDDLLNNIFSKFCIGK